MAPILAFTAEEIWDHMPKRKNEVKSVHLSLLPTVNETSESDDLAARWTAILKLRAEAAKALEAARASKIIGHSLDAEVTMRIPENFFKGDAPEASLLRCVLIVSKVILVADGPLQGAFKSEAVPQLEVVVRKVTDPKCERCWVHDHTVGSDQTHGTICHRCVESLKVTQGVAH
jgi:isoleucyl-tRNA synthetase